MTFEDVTLLSKQLNLSWLLIGEIELSIKRSVQSHTLLHDGVVIFNVQCAAKLLIISRLMCFIKI